MAREAKLGRKPTNPGLWSKAKKHARATSEGAKPGKWSARKAALAQIKYERAGGKWRKIAAPKPAEVKK